MSDQSAQRVGDIRSIQATDGARLEYEVFGCGPPLVMLHGILAARASFSRQRAELAGHHRLIMVSARGHDGSDDRLPENYGAGLSGVDDLIAVLDAERLDRVSLFGHSAGGITAFVFACRYPERVDRLVLIEPTLLSILPLADRAPVMAAHETIANAAETGGPEAAVQALMTSVGGDAWTNLDAETQTRRLRALAQSAPMVGPHARALLKLMVTEADVRGLRPPALLLHGTLSASFEGIIADTFHTLRPDLPVISIEGAGHNVHRDRADVVNPLLLSFLAPDTHWHSFSSHTAQRS